MHLVKKEEPLAEARACSDDERNDDSDADDDEDDVSMHNILRSQSSTH